MRVGVGYSENPETPLAGREAAGKALSQAEALHGSAVSRPCDLVLMFSTARHDAEELRASVAAAAGEGVPIVGGGAVGAISKTEFGYAGDQVILALLWFETASCQLVTQGNLIRGEFAAGEKLGKKLAAAGTHPDSPVLLFYDAIDNTKDGVRLTMATPLLAGIEQSLGFLPNLLGAGLQGDYMLSPTEQWNGKGTAEHTALALKFSGDLQVDSIILHGCHPATSYYTVTKADQQTILEINNQPAIPFMEQLLDGEVPAERFPFNLILGVNRGGRWDEFDEEKYASRLCLALDRERNGIVMFEPDLTAGTEFQVMYRTLFLDYMRPRIESVFKGLNGRKAVFAMYIDCAGRAAGHSGIDLEDAVVVQKSMPLDVPLLGIYTGVEIGKVQGRPRGLDWTGVFCLFSVPGDYEN